MYKIWNKEDIKNILKEISVKLNFPCDDVPIELSNKMTSCKGKFMFIQKGNKFIPKAFRFSNSLVNGLYREEIVRETIIHEYIHYYCIIKNQYKHGHDKYFKSMCRICGISDNTYFTYDQEVTTKLIKAYKYEIICIKCNNVVGKRQRKTGISNLLKKYRSKCCNSKLKCKELI